MIVKRSVIAMRNHQKKKKGKATSRRYVLSLSPSALVSIDAWMSQFKMRRDGQKTDADMQTVDLLEKDRQRHDEWKDQEGGRRTKSWCQMTTEEENRPRCM
mmetsp:Transcript_39380/g.77495  ORF Transcript_39380/g.77495 Transcript_39380/m.77495 type:complete len:101 (-) Transcript_39380:286-588(-)